MWLISIVAPNWCWPKLLGLGLMGMERLEQAEQPLSRALELAPWQAEWRLRLLDQLVALGRRDEAWRVLAQTPRWTPALEEFQRVHALTATATSASSKRKSGRSR